MFSACFEPEVLSPGRRLYLQLWYGVFTCTGISSLIDGRVYSLLIPLHVNKLYHNCEYNRLPNDAPSGSRHLDKR